MTLAGFVRHVEGKTTLIVPETSLKKSPPDLTPAFFNPRGHMVRDVSVVAFEAFAKGTTPAPVFADPLAGVGGRSLRVAKECPSISLVRVNDINPVALAAAREGATSNGLNNMEFTNLDANFFLSSLSAPDLRPGIIDVDPFGTPAPFVESALRAVSDGGLLAVTATDTAVLSGLYPQVSYRKYGSISLRTDYSRESMLRVVLGLVAHRGLVYDMVMEPLFCHADQHYARVYSRVRISPSDANASLSSLGFLLHCFKCGHREASRSLKEACPACHGRLKAAGPAWIGELHDAAFLGALISVADAKGMKKYIPLFERAKAEIGLPPFYYKIPVLTDSMGIPSVSPAELSRRLIGKGFRAVRSSVDAQGVKTDAPVADVIAALGEGQPLKPRHTK